MGRRAAPQRASLLECASRVEWVWLNWGKGESVYLRFLGDWNFLNWWWWRPIIEPIAGLLWLLSFIAGGAIIYAFISSRTRMRDYREMVLPPEDNDLDLPEDEAEYGEYMDQYFPDVSEDEILEMEEILDTVIREDIHPDMAREIEERGIPVHLLSLPTPGMVKEVGSVPLAVWIPSMGAIEIYAAPMKMHCKGNTNAYRGYMGNLLLHEMGHALGLDEPKIKDFGV